MGTAKFKIDETFKRIVAFAAEKAQPILFVKDHGIYIMTSGLKDDPAKDQHVVAYAEGCDPTVGDFDDWYDRARTIAGGDDFGEELDVGFFQQAVDNGSKRLDVNLTATQIRLVAC